MGGLNIFQITLTAKRQPRSGKHGKKKLVYVQARLHSAETHSSLIMRDILNELVNNYSNYEDLLQRHIIKLVPMINPDGVAIGNARSSLAGCDLNRRWATPSSSIHPEIYFLKGSMKTSQD